MNSLKNLEQVMDSTNHASPPRDPIPFSELMGPNKLGSVEEKKE